MIHSLKNYTLRYFVFIILLVIAVWALLFYAFILDEVYDNVDDGLKNQKIEIIRETFKDPSLLKTDAFGINQYRILPIKQSAFNSSNILHNDMIYMPYDGEKEPYRVLTTAFYAVNGDPYQLEIRTSTVEEDDLLKDLFIALIVLYVVLVLSIYLVNTLVIRKAWRPFHTILNNLAHHELGADNLFTNQETKIKEFNTLNTQIEKMIDRNEQVFQQQKSFIENASHELLTPLAITINQLDLLMNDEQLVEHQLVKISEAKSSLHRLVNLNKSLLMLSKIENAQYALNDQVNFNEVIRSVTVELEDFFEFKNIDCEYIENGQFISKANTDLIKILCSNLLRNAIKYSPNYGIIRLNVSTDSITVSNTSLGVPLNSRYIFNRFYKQSSDNLSTGLGLSIVKSIIDTTPHLQINYSFVDNLHQFQITK